MALPLLQLREPLVLLRGGAEGVDGVHHQRALHRDEAAQAGVAALQLLHHLPVGDVGHAGAAVAGEIGAEEAEFAQLGHQVHGEGGFAIVLFDDGQDFVVHELAGGLADEESSSFSRESKSRKSTPGKLGMESPLESGDAASPHLSKRSFAAAMQALTEWRRGCYKSFLCSASFQP